jgi:hypothetical protein
VKPAAAGLTALLLFSTLWPPVAGIAVGQRPDGTSGPGQGPQGQAQAKTQAGSAARAAGAADAIDRQALVTRHNVTLTRPDPLTPLSLGNGDFAFTADITGLQTFPAFHDGQMPLGTQSTWGWHTSPNPEGYTLADALVPFDSHGRTVTYPDQAGEFAAATGDAIAPRRRAAVDWLRANPHRIDLGRLGLRLPGRDGAPARIEDLRDTRQTLDLWRGALESRFTLDGQLVLVRTIVHPSRDIVAVHVESPLLRDGRAGVTLAFAGAAAAWDKSARWNDPDPDAHHTHAVCAATRCTFERRQDEDRYVVRTVTSRGVVMREAGAHRYDFSTTRAIAGSGADSLDIVVAFASPAMPSTLSPTLPLPTFVQAQQAAAAHWQAFWRSGGAIDLAGSTDPRAPELERRVVLSQYLTAIEGGGRMPAQETGLGVNSWFGKFHLEMYWWHAAHFALWGRPERLERGLAWYRTIAPRARETAARQGYRGVRWPKMVGPDGRESPSEVGAFLIWQQPHPIYLAELIYRAKPARETLERYRDLVFDTADFMASYAAWDQPARRYVLGPPLIPAQESYGKDRARVIDPTFELAYWQWALTVAQRWRLRLGLPPSEEWANVARDIARPTVRDGRYAAIEPEPYTIRKDHPSMLMAFGFVPRTPLIDPVIMRNTLDDVLREWDWQSTWGWDYPMIAMTATRVARPQQAIDALLMDAPKNRYLASGQNFQELPRLPLYLPGNGGLLAAVAMMAAGWDESDDRAAPGFPADGRWKVRWEGLRPMP